MKLFLRCSLLLLAFVNLVSAQTEPPPELSGHWEGQITLPTNALAIRVDLQQTGETWSGTIDIPAQGLRGFVLSPPKVDGATVLFTMPKVSGAPVFTGRLEKSTGLIEGTFTQNGLAFPFKLARKAKAEADANETPAKGIPGEGIGGHWMGTLQPAPTMEMRLALEITKSPDGKFVGAMISLDQDGSRIPMSELSETAGAVKLKIARVGGTYQGQLSADGSEMAGEWQQAAGKLPLIFRRVANAVNTGRPQDPKKPYPYIEELVTVPNDAAGIKLAGTLTLPKGDGPFPAVVFITGSGPQDRNETLMGHRPFWVLADHLTRQGFAVLRCDDRGVGRSTGDFSQAVVADFVSDALAGVTWLRGRKEIDAKRIGLLGHSEGGMIAPLAAVAKPGEVAFIVLLAGVGVPIEDLLIRQGQDLQRVTGASEASIAKNVAVQREAFAMLKETPASVDTATVEQKARAIIERSLEEFTPEQRAAMGLTEAMIGSQSKMIASPWFRNLITFDPRPVLRGVMCPVLAINGEKDVQVSAKENLAGIRAALEAGGNKRVKVEELPGLNHLFQTCTTGAINEYGQIAETISPVALELISSWLREQVGP